ncbi:uncharacterized protein METZ01_LOCUS492041 [marine metagenome]|uniref:Uncharacterized protein n=1 Tax=marine metagenome TaxID=408172 RepID=A0A383D3R7_9ZZZZ
MKIVGVRIALAIPVNVQLIINVTVMRI